MKRTVLTTVALATAIAMAISPSAVIAGHRNAVGAGLAELNGTLSSLLKKQLDRTLLVRVARLLRVASKGLNRPSAAFGNQREQTGWVGFS